MSLREFGIPFDPLQASRGVRVQHQIAASDLLGPIAGLRGARLRGSDGRGGRDLGALRRRAPRAAPHARASDARRLHARRGTRGSVFL